MFHWNFWRFFLGFMAHKGHEKRKRQHLLAYNWPLLIFHPYISAGVVL
jgi:hypothetical protein